MLIFGDDEDMTVLFFILYFVSSNEHILYL